MTGSRNISGVLIPLKLDSFKDLFKTKAIFSEFGTGQKREHDAVITRLREYVFSVLISVWSKSLCGLKLCSFFLIQNK